jgi:hypothetical protein
VFGSLRDSWLLRVEEEDACREGIRCGKPNKTLSASGDQGWRVEDDVQNDRERVDRLDDGDSADMAGDRAMGGRVRGR